MFLEWWGFFRFDVCVLVSFLLSFLIIHGQILAEMLRPMSPAFTELWLDGEKAATVEWRKNVDAVPGLDVDTEMAKDNGRGIIVDHPVEPLYGDIYLPRESLLCVYLFFGMHSLLSG